MPNTAPRPWRIFLPLALVLLIGLLWTAYWFMASGIAKQRFADLRAAKAAEGMVLTCTDEGWGGFPFHFEFSCTSPIMTYEDAAQLRSENLLLVALAYAPWQVAALLDGPSTLAAQGILPTRIDHERALAVFTLDGDNGLSMSSEVPSASIEEIGQAVKVTLHSRPAAKGGTDIAASVTGLNYALPDQDALTIDQADVLAVLREDQTLKVDKLEARQGALRAWGSGMLQLDEQHRISGQINAETNDIKALLDLLSPHVQLSDGQKSNLRTMLGLLGNEARALLIAKDGVLYVGPFRIADLPPLY